MKKDIIIPEVNDVYVAVVQEFNEKENCNDWIAYLINDKEVAIEMVIILSSGDAGDKMTSKMRKKVDVLQAKSYAKIEFLTEEVLSLNNQFQVTFFEGHKMYDKRFTFAKNTITTNALQNIPLMESKGVLGK